MAAGPVFVASGNHDLDGPGAHGEQVASWLQLASGPTVHIDGTSVDIGDTRFTVCPWWDGPITREEVSAQLAAAAVARPARWVWLYHAPPAGHRSLQRRPGHLPRSGTCRLDRGVQPRDRALWPHPSGTLGIGRLLARTARQDVGLQRRKADRQGPTSHHLGHRRRHCPLVRGLRVGNPESGLIGSHAGSLWSWS